MSWTRLRRATTALAMISAALMLISPAAVAAPSAPPVPPYEPIGREISGSPTAQDAPELAAGDWLDRLGGRGSERDQLFYLLPRTITDSTFHISATIPSPKGFDSDGLHLQVINDQESCAEDDEFTSRQGRFVSVGVVVPEDHDQTDKACVANDAYILRITHGHPSAPKLGLDRAVPLEIRVIEEPPAQGTVALPEPPVEPDFTEPSTEGKLTETHGGAGFADPTVLESGGYSGKITTGELQVFAVDLDWGQHLTAVARTPVLTNDYAEVLYSNSSYLTLRVYAPDRAPADVMTSGDRSDLLSDEGSKVTNMTVPVAYANRGESGRRSTSIAGRYLVVLTLDELAKSRTQVPYTLGIGVNGEPDEEPSYVDRQRAKGPQGTGATDGVPTEPARIIGYLLGGLGTVSVLFGAVTLIIHLVHRRRL